MNYLKNTLILLLALSGPLCFAQYPSKQVDIRQVITSIIIKNIDRGKYDTTPENTAYLFSVMLSFNELGRVDTVFFSKNSDKQLVDVMRLDENLVKRIKSANIEYQNYSSKLVLIPLFFYNSKEDGVNYYSGFLKSLENLFPDFKKNPPKKPIVILDPLLNPFTRPIR